MATPPAPSLVAEYESLLGQLMIPSTEIVRAAETALEQNLKDSASALALLQLIVSHPHAQVSCHTQGRQAGLPSS